MAIVEKMPDLACPDLIPGKYGWKSSCEFPSNHWIPTPVARRAIISWLEEKLPTDAWITIGGSTVDVAVDGEILYEVGNTDIGNAILTAWELITKSESEETSIFSGTIT